MSRDRAQLSEAAVLALTLPTEPWLSCGECFRLSDQFAEVLLTDPATTLMEPMFVHLRACPACAEEAESLVALLAEEQGVNASAALRRLQA